MELTDVTEQFKDNSSVIRVYDNDREGLRRHAIWFGQTDSLCEFTKSIDMYSEGLYEREWLLESDEVENIVYLEQLVKSDVLYQEDTVDNFRVFNTNVIIALSKLKDRWGYMYQGDKMFLSETLARVDSFRVINDSIDAVCRTQLNAARYLNFFSYYFGFFFLLYLYIYLSGTMTLIGAIGMSLVMGWTLPETIISVINIKKQFLGTGNAVEFWRRGLSPAAATAGSTENCSKIPAVYLNVFQDFGDCTCFWGWAVWEIYNNLKAKSSNDFSELAYKVTLAKLLEALVFFGLYFFLRFKVHHVAISLNVFILALYNKIEVGKRRAHLKMQSPLTRKVFDDYARPYDRVRVFLRSFVPGAVLWDNQLGWGAQKDWLSQCVLNPLFALRAILQLILQFVNARHTDEGNEDTGVLGAYLWPYDLYIVICTMIMAFAQIVNVIMLLNIVQSFFRRTDAFAASEYYQACLEQKDLTRQDLEYLKKSDIKLKATFFQENHMKKVCQYEMRQYSSDSAIKWLRHGRCDDITGRAIWKHRFGNYPMVSLTDAEWLFGADVSTVAILLRREKQWTDNFVGKSEEEKMKAPVLSVEDIEWLEERLATALKIVGAQRQEA